MLSTMTWVSLGVVSLLISLCIMTAPFPAGDVSTGDGAPSNAVDAVSLGAVFVLVDELEVAFGFTHVSPRMSSNVCQCCAIPASIVR